MHHAPISERDHHEHRFLFAAAAHFLRRHRAREHRNVLRRAAQAVVEFVLPVHECGGQPLHDRMIRRAVVQREFVLLAVAATATGRGVERPLAVAEAQIRAAFFIAPAPAADADHLVVGRPFGERIVRRMDGHEAAAASHEFLECLLRRRGPRLAVVVRDDDGVVGKFRLPRFDPLPFLGRGGHVHDEDARLLKDLLHHRRGHLPLVIVLAVHDEDFDFVRSGGGDCECERGEEECFHARGN